MQPIDAKPEGLMKHLTLYCEPGDDGTRGDMVQRYPTDAKPEPCEACGGKGYHKAYKAGDWWQPVTCPVCHGTGHKPREEKR